MEQDKLIYLIHCLYTEILNWDFMNALYILELDKVWKEVSNKDSFLLKHVWQKVTDLTMFASLSVDWDFPKVPKTQQNKQTNLFPPYTMALLIQVCNM